MGPHEPYWRTNTSFSPPPSRWDFRFQSEAMQFGSHDGVQLYGSSASSNSRESRSWMRGNNLASHQFLASDSIGPYFSSPSDISPVQQWTPPAIQEISSDDYATSRSDIVLRPLPFSPAMEGTSAGRDSGGSMSSRSDSSLDYESMVKSHPSHHRNFASRRCFMSKAVHPLLFPSEVTSPRENTHMTPPRLVEFSTPQRDGHQLSSASGSVDLSEIPEPFEYNLSNSPSDRFRCGLCERLLSQRSPWSSRRIVKSGDMPIAGVLSCLHVFHADCLDQTIPKARKNDPPCPICVKAEEENSPEQRNFFKLTRTGPSKTWGSCGQAGDCVEGALHTPAKNNTFLSLNRSRLKKTMSLKGNPGREYPGKLRKSGTFSSLQLFTGSSLSKAGEGSGFK